MGYLNIAHYMLSGCAAFYLIWWIAFFFPGMPKLAGASFYAGAACIVAAAILGIGAIGVGIYGMSSAQVSPVVPNWAIAIAGAALYVALVFVTKDALDRPVTTELILFTGWLTFELCVLNTAFAVGGTSVALIAALVAMVVIIFAISLVCYVLYFNLPAVPSFIDGAVPLVLVGIASVIMAILL